MLIDTSNILNSESPFAVSSCTHSCTSLSTRHGAHFVFLDISSSPPSVMKRVECGPSLAETEEHETNQIRRLSVLQGHLSRRSPLITLILESRKPFSLSSSIMICFESSLSLDEPVTVVPCTDRQAAGAALTDQPGQICVYSALYTCTVHQCAYGT